MRIFGDCWVAEVFADIARRAFQRVGIQEGWRVLECGCGPIGAFLSWRRLVGQNGKVVGVDFSQLAVQISSAGEIRRRDAGTA
jgi:ubiquinone/menaquinone biosynthesis C-methylase UbiE